MPPRGGGRNKGGRKPPPPPARIIRCAPGLRLRLIHARVRVAANRGLEGGDGPRRLTGDPERRAGPGSQIKPSSGLVAPTVQVVRIEYLVEGQARLQRLPSVVHVG